MSHEKLLSEKDYKKVAKMLREDKKQVRSTYDCSKEMIRQSRVILDRLGDRFLTRLVDVTELRLDRYFLGSLKLS